MAKPKALSGRAFARLDGCSEATVRAAHRRGRLAPDKDGRFDPGHPTNAAWLKRTKQPAQRQSGTDRARLQVANAKLQSLEFEVEVRRKYYERRAPLALSLHIYADTLLDELRRFPSAAELVILSPDAEEREAFGVVLRDAIERHVDEVLGDVHERIERELDQAGTRWRGHRPEPAKDMQVPPFMPASTLADAERRRADAVTGLEQIKVAVRRGRLLAKWPAKNAAGGLMIDWRQQCLEWLSVRQGPHILTRMRRPITTEHQWALHRTLAAALKPLLGRVDQTARAAILAAPESVD
jgi:hypothetical protein